LRCLILALVLTALCGCRSGNS